ncbi:MAG: SIMPL domain-containing protein [Mariprofundaceae bacterium]|nr:SIMPL domain-containing protein [Mariprofundaceae bacterium]
MSSSLHLSLAEEAIVFHIKAMKYLIALSPLFIIQLFTAPAWANDAAPPDKGTIVSVSATATTQLANDEAVLNYRIEASGPNAKALQRQVNTIASRAHEALAAFPALKQQTTGRSLQVMNHYDKALGRQVRDGWRLVQSEQVTGRDVQTVVGWVEEIEKAGAYMERLSFTVSEKSSRTAADTLRMQAIRTFRTKASAIADALGATSFRIVSLRSDERRPPVPIQQRGVMALSSAESAPSMNSGESRLSVTVSGEILLPEKAFSVKRD